MKQVRDDERPFIDITMATDAVSLLVPVTARPVPPAPPAV